VIDRLAILGAGGDLARRHLLPALADLREQRLLPDGFRTIAVGRERGAPIAAGEWVMADATDAEALGRALEPAAGPLVVYLALPPAVFEPTLAALAQIDLDPQSRIVVEKPFGTDGASASRLNELLARIVPEERVHRVDHFLAKQTVQNVIGLRFANRIFEPLWNAHHVERVELRWDETLALEGRAGYYDAAGALRDMVQNHLLQLLCLVAMEPPATLGERDLRDRKADVLRAVRSPMPDEIASTSIRARYRGYAAESGVDPARGTETFAAATFWIDNWRWAGVPFRVRTGKALAADRHEIAVVFRPVPHLAFGQTEDPEPNLLRLQLDPDRMSLRIVTNGAGDRFTLEEAELDTDFAAQELPAYAHVLLDVLSGDPTLAVRGDEAEESWRIVEPILAAWSAGTPALLEYDPGSDGPG